LHNNDKIDPHQILYFLLKMGKFIYHKETLFKKNGQNNH